MNEELTSKLRKRQPKWTQIVFWAFMAIASLLLLFALLAPMFLGYPGKPSCPEISNAKQIGLTLLEFESKYGTFPSDKTISLVTKEYPSHGYNLTGKSSNAAFRQIFAANIKPEEVVFYANIKGAKIPDGDFSSEHCLQKGEVGFAYISGLSTKSNPSTPILCAPLIPGTKKFDPKPFNGRAIILKLDQSVTFLKLRPDGTAILGGKDLFECQLWDGKVPDIRYPE